MKSGFIARGKCLVFGSIVAGLAILSVVNVEKRVTAINFDGLYGATSIYEQSEGHQIIVREYPSQEILGFYVFATPRGSMSVSCILSDFSKSLIRSSHQMGATSHAIGDESYFQYQGIDPKLELAYRRYNAIVSFKSAPDKVEAHYEDSERRSASSLDADKKELERIAMILDQAILNGNPNVKLENIKAYQIASVCIRGLIARMLWTRFAPKHGF
jgi:hypothetical protein